MFWMYPRVSHVVVIGRVVDCCCRYGGKTLG